jgi:cysteine desulfurase family protein
MNVRTIYLDNAATSFPKPGGMSDRIKYYMDNVGASINRSVYSSAEEAGMVALSLRERAKRFFNLNEAATHVIITPGATAGLNYIIKGLLKSGDHCIVSSMEHNAVMRPLSQIAGVEFSRIPCDGEGRIIEGSLETLFRPNTRLVIIAHGSNVCGTVQNAEEIGQICARHGVPFALDAAQTAGHYPVDFTRFNLSALAVPGHKGLLGPTGIGLLLLSDSMARALDPLIAGGTGSASDKETLPDYLPDRFESGTLNMPGIYGLEDSLGFIEKRGIDSLRAHEIELTERFISGIEGIDGVRLCGTRNLANRVGVISLDFVDKDNAQIAYRLETEFGILTRCGLHCAPNAHKTLSTFPQGTVRFSLGFASTKDDVDAAIDAVKRLALI